MGRNRKYYSITQDGEKLLDEYIATSDEYRNKIDMAFEEDSE